MKATCANDIASHSNLTATPEKFLLPHSSQVLLRAWLLEQDQVRHVLRHPIQRVLRKQLRLELDLLRTVEHARLDEQRIALVDKERRTARRAKVTS